MRLPYLQLAEESWALARELAAILGCDRHRAMSLQVDLWKWALGLETDGQPSGQVLGKLAVARLAGAVEWDGDAAELAEALVEVGLLEVIEGGLRVRGLDRYAGAWRRQDADRQRKADFRARVSATRKESAPPTSAPRPQSVRRTSAGRPHRVRKSPRYRRRRRRRRREETTTSASKPAPRARDAACGEGVRGFPGGERGGLLRRLERRKGRACSFGQGLRG